MSEVKERTPLQQQIRALFLGLGVSEKFMEASDHRYGCRCDLCKAWWQELGPDEDGLYGPFSPEEIEGGV